MNNDIKNLREILLSDDGISKFITHLIKNMMEKLLNQELMEFLKYDKYSYEGRNSGNSRNGYYTRNYETVIAKIRRKDYQAFIESLKTIYEAPSKEQALIMLDEFSLKWSKIYPRVVSDWNNSINTLLTFYNYSTSIRKCIYTINWIERTNKELKRRLKTKDSLPTIDAAEKILYICRL